VHGKELLFLPLTASAPHRQSESFLRQTPWEVASGREGELSGCNLESDSETETALCREWAGI
jgi:hypothetical protein